MKNKIGWMVIRCLVAAFFASSAPAMFNDPKTAPQDFPFGAFMFFLVFGSIQMPFAFRREMRKERKKGKMKDWSIPSWFTNPFSGPPHFMHMGGNAFVITGLVGLLQSALSGKLSLMNLFPLAFGWSIIIGNTVFYAFMYYKLKTES
jgi:hypothetical protein